MKPSQVANSLRTLIPIHMPAMILGSPGCGKSAIVRQVADSLGIECLDVRAVLYDPVDFRGLPSIKDGFTDWSTPGFLPRDGEGLLFLDELNAAPEAVQAALYRLILDRELDGYRLPDGWSIVAAGNKSTDGAITRKLSSALKSRLVTFQMEADLDDWRRHAVHAGIAPEVIAFLSFRPALFDAFAKPVTGEAPLVDPRTTDSFPVPRTWEMVSRVLQARPSPDIELGLYTATVGQAAAGEFMGFLRIFRHLPSVDGILLSPEQSPVPTDLATLFALANALARASTDANFPNVVTYANRLPAEISVALVKQAVDRKPELQQTRPFTEWAALHSDVLV